VSYISDCFYSSLVYRISLQIHMYLSRFSFPLNVVCESVLQNRMHCYRAVIQETCNVSAADVNILNTIIYNAKFSNIVNKLCSLGETRSASYCVVRQHYKHLWLHSVFTFRISRRKDIHSTCVCTFIRNRTDCMHKWLHYYLLFCYMILHLPAKFYPNGTIATKRSQN